MAAQKITQYGCAVAGQKAATRAASNKEKIIKHVYFLSASFLLWVYFIIVLNDLHYF